MKLHADRSPGRSSRLLAGSTGSSTWTRRSVERQSTAPANRPSAPSSSGVGEAFDLSQGRPKTIVRYDTAPLVRPENIDKKSEQLQPLFERQALGKLLLLARPAVRGGLRLRDGDDQFVWDMHADGNNAPVAEGMSYMGPPLDHAVSAFLEDVEARGLSDKILLVVLRRDGPHAADQQERRPRPLGQPGAAAAGRRRLKMGQVIGQSDRNGGEPRHATGTIPNLIATS